MTANEIRDSFKKFFEVYERWYEPVEGYYLRYP